MSKEGTESTTSQTTATKEEANNDTATAPVSNTIPASNQKADEPPTKKAKKQEEENAAAVSSSGGGTTTVDSQEEVLKIIKESSSSSKEEVIVELVLLDARREDEILEAGFIKSSNPHHRWVHVSCEREAARLLEETASYIIPNKNTPIITYCRSGARSGRAKAVLLGQGYKTVVNAGGFGDLDWLQNALSS